MRNISNAFKKAIQDGGPFYAYAVITLSDSTELQLTSENDFFISGNKYDHSFSSVFPMGEAACKVLDIGINNTTDRFSAADFYGAEIVLYTEIEYTDNHGNTNLDRMQEGVFYVTESKASGDIIEISAADSMQKTDVDMPTITYPANLNEIVRGICTKCGLTRRTQLFPNYRYRVTVAPPEMTCREMLGYVAQIVGGNALIYENGELDFKVYTKNWYNSSKVISGGKFGDGNIDSVSGGVFGDATSDTISSGELDTISDYIVLSNYTTEPEIATDDIIITGVSYTYKQNKVTHTELYGEEGYVLKIENPLIAGNIINGLTLIGNHIIGMKIRPFSGSFSPNPAIELMDNVYVVDRKGNIYQSFVTSNTFNYLGYSEIANETQSPEQNNAKYKSNSSVIYRQVQKDIAEERVDWQNAVDQLEEDLDNASGLYETQEVQPDQSIIYYFHDKQTLAESEIVMKITSQALAISTDGGQTYPTGITVDGNAIVSILSSVGINADWITTGTLKVGGTNNTDGQIDIYDSANALCGRIDNEGVKLTGGVNLEVNNISGGLSVTVSLDRIVFKTSNSKFAVRADGKKLFISDITSYPEKPIITIDQSGRTSSTSISGDVKILNTLSTKLSGCNIEPGGIKYGGNDLWSGTLNYGGNSIVVQDGLITRVIPTTTSNSFNTLDIEETAQEDI